MNRINTDRFPHEISDNHLLTIFELFFGCSFSNGTVPGFVIEDPTNTTRVAVEITTFFYGGFGNISYMERVFNKISKDIRYG